MVLENKSLIVILKNDRVIICQENGYKIRTLENDGGVSATDKNQNNFGALYWEKVALKDNDINREEILMSVWSDKAFFKN